MNKKIILPITPQTSVNTTQHDRIWFVIPEECPRNCGEPRRVTSKDPGCRHSLPFDGLRRLRRIRKYNQYKIDLRGIALGKHFDIPLIGAGIMFFLPMPIRFPKYKRNILHFGWHQQKPDLKNLLEAFEDALLKKDEGIAFYSHLGKKWVDTIYVDDNGDKVIGSGWIEVTMPS